MLWAILSIWCRLEDLNPQPTDYDSVALPGCAKSATDVVAQRLGLLTSCLIIIRNTKIMSKFFRLSFWEI